MSPSLGLVDVMRASDDIERNSDRFEQIAKEMLYRSGNIVNYENVISNLRS